MHLLNKIDKILLMDKIMLRIKKKLKSWESVLYFESHIYIYIYIYIYIIVYYKYIYIYIYIIGNSNKLVQHEKPNS